MNSVIRGWNEYHFTIPTISFRRSRSWEEDRRRVIRRGSFGSPQIPYLAAGAVVDSATLAVVGEGSAREIVAPETLLRQTARRDSARRSAFSSATPNSRGLVRTEVVDANTGVARSLARWRGLKMLTAPIEPDHKDVRLNYDRARLARPPSSFARVGPSGAPAGVRGASPDEPWSPGPDRSSATLRSRSALRSPTPPQSFDSTGVVIDTHTTTSPSRRAGVSDIWLNDLARVTNTILIMIESLPELDYATRSAFTTSSPAATRSFRSDIAHTPEL